MTVLTPQNRHRRTGFTLVELLIVMGIMVLLMGVLLPAVMHAMKAGRKSRVQADFQTINLALEAYKTDFGDYPRNIDSNVPGQWDMSGARGAELLCRALIGPGPAFGTANSGADGAGANGSGDSTDANSKAAGPGFRTRSGIDSNGNQQAQGKVWGPYLSPDKFRIFTLSTLPAPTWSANSAGTIDATCVLLDSQGHAILYYPAAPVMPNISAANAFISVVDPPLAPALYNWFDNSIVPPDPLNNPLITASLSQTDFEKLLGDTNNNGSIDSTTTPPEIAAYTGPYILWTAGEDSTFGISARDGKSDDITNFDFPVSLRR